MEASCNRQELVLSVQRTEGVGSVYDTWSWLLGNMSHLPIFFKLFDAFLIVLE